MKSSRIWFLRKFTQISFFIFAILIFLGLINSSSLLFLWGALHIFPVTAGINSYIYSKFIIITILLLISILFAGRLYCSYLCPIGLIEDISSTLGVKFKFKQKTPVNYKYFKLLLFLACFTSAIFGVFIWGWLDHSSNFGRILTDFIQPLFIKSLSPFADYLNKTSNFQISELKSTSIEFLYALLFLTILIISSALRPRWYCNTLCPSGALYGILGKHSFISIKNNSNCKNCGQCDKICPAACIKNGIIDKSLCVACFECIGKCSFNALRINYGANPKNQIENNLNPEYLTNSAYQDTFNSTGSQKSETTVPGQKLNTRREFLLTSFIVAAGAVIPKSLSILTSSNNISTNTVMPPGADNARDFFNNCSACHLCISVCPSKVLIPSGFENGLAGLSKPRMDYNKSYCAFECNKCSTVCPNQAIKYHSVQKKQLIKIGVAELNTTETTACVAYRHHRDCGACAEHCPTGAVYMEKEIDGNIFVPKLRKPYCIGCGICQHVCPISGDNKPIKVRPFSKQGTAKDPKEINADKKLKNTTNDFPF